MEAIVRFLRLLLVTPLVTGSSFSATSFFLQRKLISFHGPGENRAEDVVAKVQKSAPQLFNSAEELAREQGLDLESHRVETEDGYVLTLHRLRSKEDSSASDDVKRPPVLLVHGFLCASHLWLLTPRQHALAYLLWDHGYDVWLANLRGNTFSRNHVRLEPTDPGFWEFSWHEMGFYDAPAMVDFILRETNYKKMSYVGHSMGNTVYYVMMTTRPEYNKKVGLHIGLSPAVYMGPRRHPLVRIFANQGPNIIQYLESQHMNELLPASMSRIAFLFLTCNAGNIQRSLCKRMYDVMYGPCSKDTDPSKISFYVSHFAQGTSIRTLGHFIQSISTGNFRQWDEGCESGNLKRYGCKQPPDYNISLVTAPSAIWFSDDDWVVFPEDVVKLAQEQKNVVQLTKVSQRPYNHMDFVLSPSAVRIVYENVLKLLKNIKEK